MSDARERTVAGGRRGRTAGTPIPAIAKYPVVQSGSAGRSILQIPLRAFAGGKSAEAVAAKNDILCENGESYN